MEEEERKGNLINRVAKTAIYILEFWSVSRRVTNDVTAPVGAMAASYGLVYIFKPGLEEQARM